jgi:hypothetical protein
VIYSHAAIDLKAIKQATKQHDNNDPQHGQHGIYTMDDRVGKGGPESTYDKGKTLTCSAPLGNRVTPIDSLKDQQPPQTLQRHLLKD